MLALSFRTVPPDKGSLSYEKPLDYSKTSKLAAISSESRTRGRSRGLTTGGGIGQSAPRFGGPHSGLESRLGNPTPLLGFNPVNFSAKTEYGVRLMIELGRQDGGEPTSLKAIAEAEGLPLSYLEHVVADLKRAQLVTSTRGAHGGYRLAQPAEDIRMDAVIAALEGGVAPMSCFVDDTVEGKVLCSHHDDGELCATRLLWMRVQGGVIEALQRTTLAELVAFSHRDPNPLIQIGTHA